MQNFHKSKLKISSRSPKTQYEDFSVGQKEKLYSACNFITNTLSLITNTPATTKTFLERTVMVNVLKVDLESFSSPSLVTNLNDPYKKRNDIEQLMPAFSEACNKCSSKSGDTSIKVHTKNSTSTSIQNILAYSNTILKILSLY